MKSRRVVRFFVQGMTLVELMVAITIGLIILAAVSTVFVNSKANYTTQESSARLQESARFAMHFLARDLRMAGYYGCADDIESINSNLNPPSQSTAPNPYDFTTSIQAVEGNNVYPNVGSITFPDTGSAVTSKDAACPNYVGGRCAGTDAIAVRLADPSSSTTLATAMPNTAAAAFVEPGHGLEIGDVVLLTDCGSAELFQITNIQDGSGGNSGKKGIVHNSGTGSPGNQSQRFSRSFGPPATILKFVNRVYYVGTGTSGYPTLFRQTFDGSAREELVEGIEDLQVTFGIDTVGDRTPRAYRSADHSDLGATKANWANVVSARIALKARPVISTQSPVSNPNEVRSQEFVSTVLMRNLQ